MPRSHATPASRAGRRSALDAFYDQMVADYGAASSTPRTYLWGAELLGQYLTLAHKTIAGFSPVVWEGFAAWLMAQPDLALLSRRTATRGAKAFCEWAVTRNLCPALTREEWKRGSLPSQNAIPAALVPIPPDLADRLLQAVQTEPDPYRTVLLLVRSHQLEVAELCGAPWTGAWAAWSREPSLWVRGRKCRLQPEEIAVLPAEQCSTYLKRADLSNAGVQLIRGYAVARPQSPWLFPSPTDPARPLAADTVRNVFEDVRERCGARVTMRQWSNR